MPEIDDVGPESLKTITEYFEAQGQDFIDTERGELMVDEVASASFERPESLIASLATTHDTWRRPWPPAVPVPVVGRSPAVALHSCISRRSSSMMCWLWSATATAKDGTVAFTHDELTSRGWPRQRSDSIDELMAFDIDQLRRDVIRERTRHEETQWLRYTFQRFPFVRMTDGRLLLLKAQFGIQRFFGGLLYWELWSKLGGPASKAANDFQRAMADVFEQRVGEVLKRIGATPAMGGATVVAHEYELARLLKKDDQLPSMCDWVLSSGRLVVAVDANNRVAELRNQYGTGHGQGRPRTGLGQRHAHLAVNAAFMWCQLMLDTLADPNAPWRKQAAAVKN